MTNPTPRSKAKKNPKRKPCECRICNRSRQIDAAIRLLPKPQRLFMQDIHLEFIHAEMDRDYYRAIVKGDWPDGDQIISSYRERKPKKKEV